MKVAVISDIHGNIYAFEAMLDAAKKENVEKLLILGDIVGYYYHPKEIFELMSGQDHELIQGNHEAILLDISSGKIKEPEVRKKYGSGHRRALEQLSAQQLELLFKAPEKKHIELDGIKILMSHGSPWAQDFYLYPDSSKEILNRCKEYDADIIFVGHSHYSFVCRLENCLLVNCGSVGQSRYAGGYADWALLNTGNGTIQLISTRYDIQPLLQEVEKIDPNISYLKDILLRDPHE